MLRLLWLFFPGLFVALGGPAIVNHLFAQIQGGFYSLIPGNTRVYCYASIMTLDDADTVFAPGCLSVDWKGNFGNVFSAEGIGFGEMRAKGWHIDLTGHVLPGLWDGHAHLLQYGEMLGGVQVYNTHSLNEIRARIADYRVSHPTAGTRSRWVIGTGWDQSLLPGGMPSAKDLPQDLYILLHRTDLHCFWVSPPVLDLLPSPLPPVPAGGSMPSRGVFCDNAMDLVLPFVPPTTKEEKKSFILAAQNKLHEYGIVGIHDAGVVQEDRELYEEMAESEELELRVYAMVECYKRNAFCPAQAKKVARKDGMLTVNAVKLFADGALGSWGAALIDPYSDNPKTNGTMLLSSELLSTLTTQWSYEGYQVCIHAIGDAANRAALDAISAAPPTNFAFPPFRIEHAQIIAPEDQHRMKSLGVVASIQPTHATSDQFYAEKRLGKKRLAERAYRMKSLFPRVLGSDFPVEPPAVLKGVYAAVTRRDPGTGKWVGDGRGWYPEERLTMKEALMGFTRDVAFAGGMGNKTGVIEKGRWADWVVLRRRLSLEPAEWKQWEWLRDEEVVKETWIAGRRRFLREKKKPEKRGCSRCAKPVKDN